MKGPLWKALWVCKCGIYPCLCVQSLWMSLDFHIVILSGSSSSPIAISEDVKTMDFGTFTTHKTTGHKNSQEQFESNLYAATFMVNCPIWTGFSLRGDVEECSFVLFNLISTNCTTPDKKELKNVMPIVCSGKLYMQTILLPVDRLSPKKILYDILMNPKDHSWNFYILAQPKVWA